MSVHSPAAYPVAQYWMMPSAIKLLERRCSFNAKVAEKTVPFDALVLPTVAIVPPPLAALHDDAVRSDVNQLVLRNTAIGNMLDRPCISLPCNGLGEAPVGLMLMGQPGDDRKLLSIARARKSIPNMLNTKNFAFSIFLN